MAIDIQRREFITLLGGAAAEGQGSNDFRPLWSGQVAPLAREMPARALTLKLAKEAVDRFKQLNGRSERRLFERLSYFCTGKTNKTSTPHNRRQFGPPNYP
jgi:hypothetical protein